MLLVQEGHGAVHRAVGGGPAAESSRRSPTVRNPSRPPPPREVSFGDGEAWGRDAPPPVHIEVGETEEHLHLDAGEKTERRYVLSGDEHLTWTCTVSNGYTIDFAVKAAASKHRSEVIVAGRRLGLVGVDSTRVVQERERRAVHQGFLDLAGEHKGCIGLPAVRPGGAAAILVLEVDNSFSFFRGKDITLQITKRELNQAIRESTTSETALMVSEVAARAEGLSSVRAESAPQLPKVSSLTPLTLITPTTPPTPSSPEEVRLDKLHMLLKEALRICPTGALGVRDALLKAQASLGDYMDIVEQASGPLGC